MFVLKFNGFNIQNDNSKCSNISLNVDHILLVEELDESDSDILIITTHGTFLSKRNTMFEEVIPWGFEITFIQLKSKNKLKLVNRSQFLYKYESGDDMMYVTILGEFRAKNGYQDYQETFNVKAGPIFKY